MTIYGRSEEQALLRQCLVDCSKRAATASATRAVPSTTSASSTSSCKNNLVLIRGESGIGKSSLVENAFQRAAANECFYVHGKCEELRRNAVPFLSLMEALEVLCDAIDEQDGSYAIVDQLKARFSTPNGKLIPRFNSIRRLLGYPVVTFGNKKRQRGGSTATSSTFCKQLNSELRDFLSIVSSTKPIVLFLDDVQWSCLQTLETIQFLTNESPTKEQPSNLLVVVAVRDGFEIPSQLNHFQHEIHLESLSHNALSKLVARQLKDDKVDNDDLVEVLHSRTGGNPLFASQLLDRLMDDKLVYRHPQVHEWMWDLRRIRAETSVADNIVDLLIRKIRNLSPCAQQLLKVAACTGSKFPLQIVKAVVVSTDMGFSPVDFETSLTQMEEEGMLDQQPRHGCYKFAHDRVQQASYELVPENARDSMHLRIGRSILQTMPSSDDEQYEDKTSAWKLLATEQLNRSSHLMHNQMEKVELAKLNLSSAISASQKSAFLWVATYCKTGLKLLGDYRWETQPVLTKQLSKLLA
jgi:predicted ATPase